MKKFLSFNKIINWVVVINMMATICGGILPRKVFAESVGGADEVVDVGDEADEVGGGEVGDENGEDDAEGDDIKEDDTEDGDNEEDEGEEIELPILYIKAVNPGYKIDGVNNVGEMIEIGKNSDDLVLLAGMTISYTNSSGKETVLVEFPENSFVAGENILLRLASSPMSELANMTYSATLAMKAGPLTLSLDGEILDSVCWTGKNECTSEFKSTEPTTLVRNIETGEFEHILNYEPVHDAENYKIIEPVFDDENENSNLDDENSNEETQNEIENHNEKPDEYEKNDDPTGVESENLNEKPDEDVETVSGQCENLRFSEILTYYVETQAEQFVEFYNAGEKMMMDGCQLKYKNKYYPLSGALGAKGYAVRYADDFRMTKNPKTSNVLELLDVDGEVVDVLEYTNGQKKGTTWALLDGEWEVTYAGTPGEANVYQKYRTCEEGKVINELTGNCVKEEDDEAEEKICEEGYYLNLATGRCKKIEVEVVKTCAEGYYLNKETGRCRKIVEETVKTCAEGQYLNPLTGRCKKIEVEEEKTCAAGYYLNSVTGRCRKIEVEEEKVCAEGYYLNEETGRCKKIIQNDGADYSLEAETFEESSSFVALYAVLGVVGVGVLYVIYEFRGEIKRLVRRVFRK